MHRGRNAAGLDRADVDLAAATDRRGQLALRREAARGPDQAAAGDRHVRRVRALDLDAQAIIVAGSARRRRRS